MRRAARVLAPLLLALMAACGRTVPHGGEVRDPAKPASTATAPHITTVTTATEFLPADLDLVVRVDLAKVRRDLGKEASVELMDEALASAGVEGAARETLAKADEVWLGLRIADLERGDHVMVAMRKRKGRADNRAEAGRVAQLVKPDPSAWIASDTALPKIQRFVATKPVPRAATARIYTVGQTAAVFVSPVEEQSVERVLRAGPDPSRGEPAARGLISLDLREPRLSHAMSEKVPALTKLIASIERVRATADLFGDRVELDATIRCTDERAAAKVRQYLSTFTTPDTRFAELLSEAKIDRAGAAVLVRWRVPRSWIGHALRRERASVD